MISTSTISNLYSNMGIPLFMYKKQPGIDQTKVDQGIRLSAQAVELDQTGTTVGEKEEALFTYFLSLKNFLEALLINKNKFEVKIILKKLKLLITHFENILEKDEPINLDEQVDITKILELENTAQQAQNHTLSDKVVQVAVASAVALKKSPIPNTVYNTLNYTLQTAQTIDQYLGVQKIAWEVGKVGLNKAAEIDKRFKVKEKVGAAMLTSATAILQAGLAYKQAPSYSDSREAS